MANLGPESERRDGYWAARWGLLLVAAVFLFSEYAKFQVVDLDAYHEMALWRSTLRLGHLPTRDEFAWTPTIEPIVHHEWATGMVLYHAVETLGGAGLLVVKTVLTVALAAAATATARFGGARAGVLLVGSFVAVTLGSIGLTTVRAQLFTLVGLAIMFWLLERHRLGSPRWWAWVPIWLGVYVAWVNLHAGFVVGLLLFGAYSCERWLRERRVPLLLLGVLTAMAFATAINPYGTEYLRYLAHGLTLARDRIGEWQPLWRAQDPALVATYAVSLLLAAYATLAPAQGGAADVTSSGAKRSRLRLPGRMGLFVVLLAAYAAFRHQRHLSLYAVTWFCFVPAWLEATALGATLQDLLRRHARVAAIGAVTAAVLLGALALRHEPWRLRVPTSRAEAARGLPVYPAAAVTYLNETEFQGRLMTPFEVGAYVSWHAGPRTQVSLDSRYEVAYPTAQVDRLLDLYAGRPGWEATLEAFPPDAILVRWNDPLHGLLASTPDWRTAYSDETYTLYVPKRAAEAEGKWALVSLSSGPWSLPIP